MKSLFIIRHGRAEVRSPHGGDAQRALTEEGVGEMRQCGRGLARLLSPGGLTVVLSSPLVRARQTADLVAAAFDPSPRIVELDELGPIGHMGKLMTLINHERSHGTSHAGGHGGSRGGHGDVSHEHSHPGSHGDVSIAIVGHEPGMGELVSYLLTGGLEMSVDFKKGAICRIDVLAKAAPGAGTLIWFAPPKIIRGLGNG